MIRLAFHINLIQTAYLPFLIILFLNIIEQSDNFKKIKSISLKDILFFIVLIILNLLSDLVVTVSAFYIIGFYLAITIMSQLREKFNINRTVISSSILLICYSLHKFIEHLLINTTDPKTLNGFFWGANLGSFVIPFKSQFYNSAYLSNLNYQWLGGISLWEEFAVFIGFGFLLILITSTILLLWNWFKVDSKIKNLLFLSIILLFIILPQFKITNEKLFYSPTAIIHFFPILKDMRCPTRFIYLFMFFISIPMFWILIKKGRIFNNIIATLVIFTLLFFDFYPEKYVTENQKNIPKVYYKLGEKKGESALILPYSIYDGFWDFGTKDKSQLSKIRIHKKKIYGGHLSRIDLDYFNLKLNNPFWSSLIKSQNSAPPTCDINTVRDFALKEKINYILIPDQYYDSNAHKFLKDVFTNQIITTERFSGGEIITLRN
jgi:hypothetical protein